MTNFTDAEIIDLMSELVGDRPGEGAHQVELCVPQVVQEADPVYGIPAVVEPTCRPVWGFVVPEGRFQIALANIQSGSLSGGERAFISAKDVSREELNNPDARIRFNGQMRQFKYSRQHVDRGVTRLHELSLT